ncbi:hypothetical protein N1851_021767 [Merluccius polli]|uniref:Uncharacterized protein n=1 Tax=Merluccius polli TaxID=89951 RepID=A0AA47MJ30_MERPO|nr:hypothetical protein N1851_021767 [Merluccius polli]
MVSTITETFFYKHFEPIGRSSIQPCHWLQLRAANGLAIPYVGYTESDVELCGKLMPKCGILVVKDPPSGISKVPGVLGMNVLSKCYREFFEQHGQSLFEVPSLTQAPTSLLQAFQHCHQVETQPPTDFGRVKVRGRKACRVPGGSMMLVPSTCSAQYASGIVLFEPSELGLPPGLLVSPSLVKVENGTASIPVVNVGNTDVLLYPRTSLGRKPLRWRVAGRYPATLAPNVGLLRPGRDTEGLSKLHWSHQPRQRTATPAPAPPERQRRPAEERGGSAATATGNRLQLASPGSSLEQPRPAAPLPGDQEPKAPCSRRRWEGSCLVALVEGGDYELFQALRELPPRPSCRASAEPIQPAPATSYPRDTSASRSSSPRPPVSGTEGEGGVGV